MKYILVTTLVILFALPSYSQQPNFEGTVLLPNCSGSLVRFETSKGRDQAMVLTNGHCSGGFVSPGTAIVNYPVSRPFRLMTPEGRVAGEVRSTALVYATMTKTDIAIFVLQLTFDEILKKYNIRPLTILSEKGVEGEQLHLISSAWGKVYSCQVEKVVYAVKEDAWTLENSLRIGSECYAPSGASGSPIVLAGTRNIKSVYSSANDNGRACVNNNPCEIDEQGNVTAEKGHTYAQQLYWIYDCLDENNQLNLKSPNCQLPE